jgi:two-component system phosphate regulon response regulator OmpR
MSQGNVPHLLIVDDDRRLRDLLVKFLRDQNFLITAAKDAKEAWEKLDIFLYDLMILDVMMPGETGFEFATRLRDGGHPPQKDLPILFLTAMGESDSRIEGLERGGDDYLVKPFEPRELILRIKNILKRTQKNDSSIVSIGPYDFDLQKGQLSKENINIPLTTQECELLKILAIKPGIPHSRESLATLLGEGLSERSIDVQITRLRKKIEQDPKYPRLLQTVRNQGYILWP